MAGEIEDAFTLHFRVDSGSISFGRFESEALCWERRSTFLHNHYLEEVEKCSKPGSVTEKKAYFEARLRNKGVPLVTSQDDEFIEKQIPEIDHMNASIQSDQSLDGLDNNKLAAECETRVVDKADDAELGIINFESGIQMKENLDCERANFDTCLVAAIRPFPDDHVNEAVSIVPPKNKQTSLPKKNSTSKPEHIKARLVPRVIRGPSAASKGSENKANDKVRDDRVRSKAEKKTSGDPNKCRPLHKTTTYEGSSETKGVDKINSNSGDREVIRSRSRTIVEPQRSTPQKASSRAYQSANRVKPAICMSKPGIRQDTSKSTRKDAVPRLSKSSQLSSQPGMIQEATPTSKVKAGISLPVGRKKEPEKMEKLTRSTKGSKRREL